MRCSKGWNGAGRGASGDECGRKGFDVVLRGLGIPICDESDEKPRF